MINSVELKNFKAFKKSGSVKLKKINLFVGPNSSGKSSFIQSLVMLKNCIECIDRNSILGSKQEKEDYRDIVFDNDMDNKIAYRLRFNRGKGLKRAQKAEEMETTNQISLDLDEEIRDFTVNEIEFSMVVEDGRLIIDDFDIQYGSSGKCRIYKEGSGYCVDLDGIILDCHNLIEPHKFYFRINEEIFRELSDEEVKSAIIIQLLLTDIEDKTQEFSRRLIYIESLRTKIEKAQNIEDIDIEGSVGSQGENLIKTILGINKLTDRKLKHHIEEKVNKWLEEFDLGDKLDIEKVNGDKYSVFIRNKNLGIYTNLQEVGFGTRQLLPIIIESVNSPRNSTIIVEEPETHIHPKAQSKLADLFVESVIDGDRSFIIETHSIFLVTELQILVAEGKISADDVGIYYFTQDKDGSRAIDMRLRDNGQFEEEWPSGFFDIHYLLGRKLFDLL